MFKKFILSGINGAKNMVENYDNSSKLWKYYIPFVPYPKKLVDYEATKKVWFTQLKDVNLTDEDKKRTI